MVPFAITVMAFGMVLMRLTGEDVNWQALWGLFAAGVAGLVVVFLCARNDYRRTYVTAYRETEATRMGVAEHLRRLPMSFFDKRDLSELTENLMGDVSSRESLMSSTIPQLVASCVSTAVVCVMLAFFEWRLALCVFSTLPAALLIVLAARGHERRLFERQTGARLAASARLMDYVGGIRDIRACRQVGAQSAPMRAALQTLRDIAMRVELSVDVCVSAATTVLQAGVGLTVFVGTALLAAGEVDFLTLLMFLLIASRVCTSSPRSSPSCRTSCSSRGARRASGRSPTSRSRRARMTPRGWARRASSLSTCASRMSRVATRCCAASPSAWSRAP